MVDGVHKARDALGVSSHASNGLDSKGGDGDGGSDIEKFNNTDHGGATEPPADPEGTATPENRARDEE